MILMDSHIWKSLLYMLCLLVLGSYLVSYPVMVPDFVVAKITWDRFFSDTYQMEDGNNKCRVYHVIGMGNTRECWNNVLEDY